MKEAFKTFGIVTVIVLIGLSMNTCKNDTTNPSRNGHSFPDWTDPTCTVAGNTERTCADCTQKDTRAIGYAALGHQGLTPAFAATCTAAGNSEESGTCTRSGCGLEGLTVEDIKLRLTKNK